MKRKFLKSLIALSVCVCSTATCLAADITLKIDGSEIPSDVAPQIIDGRTMVPLRAIFEAVGATVEWDADTKTIYAYKNDTMVVMTVGDTYEFIFTGDEMEMTEMDVAPQIADGRTLVPARYAAEAFGYSAYWDAETKTVDIISGTVSEEVSAYVYEENSLGIDQDTFDEIKEVFYSYEYKITNAATNEEAEALEVNIDQDGAGDYTVSIPEYQRIIDASDDEDEQYFAVMAAMILGALDLYKSFDLLIEETTGSIPSESNYDSLAAYGETLFEADDYDAAMAIVSNVIDEFSNYLDLIEEQYL